MWAYIIRRLLWMIPTFLGILLINFAVVRLRAPTLAEEMHQGAAGEAAGTRSAEAHLSNVRDHLASFHLAGNHLPALINLRGFTDKQDVLRQLRALERGDNEKSRAERSRRELELWLQGAFYVEPLVAIVADDALREFHGPASEALSVVAYDPPLPTDLEQLSEAERRAKELRNEEWKQAVIAYTNSEAEGFVTADPAYERKRAKIAELYATHRERYAHSLGRSFGAMFARTGFVDLMGKLFTGELWSESKKRPVFALIAERWQVSFSLNFLAILIAWSIAVPLGIRSARRAGSLGDRITTNTLFVLWSIPPFFLGTLLLFHLCTDSSAGVKLFPSDGLSSDGALWYSPPRLLVDLVWHAFLPLVVLTYSSFTALSRYMRGNMLDQLHTDYVRTARAKGAGGDRIVYRHALRNSLVTMITLGQGLLSALYGGFLFVEIIFSINGLGLLLYQAALEGDAPLVMGSTIVSVILFLISILLADIMYAVVDPRIRSRYA